MLRTVLFALALLAGTIGCRAPASDPTQVTGDLDQPARPEPQSVEYVPPPEPLPDPGHVVRRVAVFGMTPANERYTEDDSFLIEVKNTLRETGAFEVVTRRHVGEVLAEQKLLEQGALDKRTAPKVGAIYGVGYLVEVMYDPSGHAQGGALVTLLLLDTDTGAVVASGRSHTSQRFGAVREACAELVRQASPLPLKAGDVYESP